ncbi:nucleotidyltransferase family protein [Siminovitchia fortis]|uniref:Nucleotidyltransferase family protein n=1 Tax=Siminovitchia fortis TaxID=254758 RepID=A0A443IV13_9BACI|nr:nucleotidyltransferase family protein [Siminovitchia fortis]RWR11957.1 nucleotidyltransferase family protein [Siminovitchia fortis]WHY80781.1 nucleotidyltransferase family protein [Siminovitchia fortis]
MMEQTSAIILAAGTSSRMGTAKQLLPLGDRPILAHVIEHVLAENFSEVIAVIGHEAEAIRRAIPVKDDRFRWILNEDYRQGQGTSLKLGISQMSERHSSVMVFLADLPFISQKTIHDIYTQGNAMLQDMDAPFVVQPSFQGTAGHPVFFGHVKTEWFQQVEGDQGAKAIMGRFSIRKRVPVEDRGVLYDIDTPEAYEAALQNYRQS